jgi:hypothetical protein
MRKGLVALLIVAAVVVGVVVLRRPEPPPVTGPPPTRLETVTYTSVTMNWHEVPLAPGTKQVTRAAADGQHSFFPVAGQDGVNQLVRADGTELVRGSGGIEPLNGALDGTTLVATEIVGNRTKLSTVDMVTGQPRQHTFDFAAEAVIVAGGFAVLQQNGHCLTTINVHTLAGVTDLCDPQGGTFALLSAETDGVHWRVTKANNECGGWFRLGPDGRTERLDAADDECRAANLGQLDGWRVFAAFPRYETGSLSPGPLMARRGDREILLDNTVMDVHVCGGHVYWLSKPSSADPGQGWLSRWMPGDNDVQVFHSILPPEASTFANQAATPRCVNDVLDFVTYDAGPRLWQLATP